MFPGRPRRAGLYESLCGNTDPPSRRRGPLQFFTLFTSSALNGVKYVLIPKGLLKTLTGMSPLNLKWLMYAIWKIVSLGWMIRGIFIDAVSISREQSGPK